MGVSSTHPSYDAMLPDWEMLRDSAEGERAVKAKGVTYLPATAAHILDGQGKNNPRAKGEIDYQAYKLRASFPDFVIEAIERYVGMMHFKPATIELPKIMEPLLTSATSKGESMQVLLRRINIEQLTTGRLGLLLDVPPAPDPANPMPYVAVYSAETVTNWDDSNDAQGRNLLEMVVLNESGPERRADMSWEEVKRYRVLRLLNTNVGEDGKRTGLDAVVTVDPAGGTIYKQALVLEKEGLSELQIEELMTPPVLRGQALEEIPFVFVNTKDLISEPDRAPLTGLARLCMTIYRGEADYRHTLYMQGQETLVTIGGMIPTTANVDGDDAVRVGAGARIDLNIGGDAKYVGISSQGLSEQRSALENDRKAAEAKSGMLIAPGAGKQESGDAMSTRMSAQTATLVQIADTGAAALERVLKIAAAWMGANPDEVKITPNHEFVGEKLVARDLVEWMTARGLGAPLALESIHQNLVARGVTRMTFEEEIEKMAEEDVKAAQLTAKLAKLLPAPTPASGPQPPAKGPQG